MMSVSWPGADDLRKTLYIRVSALDAEPSIYTIVIEGDVMVSADDA